MMRVQRTCVAAATAARAATAALGPRGRKAYSGARAVGTAAGKQNAGRAPRLSPPLALALRPADGANAGAPWPGGGQWWRK